MARLEALALDPEEAIRFFRAKGMRIAFDWRDTDAALHARAFTVAKAMRLDVLEDFREAVDAAIAGGETFEAFRDRLEDTLRRKGWWGRREMTDPLTGERRAVRLGSPRRLRIVYDTNLRMAYARGRWERIERVADDRPWLRYVAVRDARTRPQHYRWHGTVLPVDHPWWKSHYPPNGWNCRCTVQQLSDYDLKDFGYAPSSGPPTGSTRTRPWTNKRTGRTSRVPVGIDPGFQHNVGRVSVGRDAADRLVADIDAAPEATARAAIGEPWRGTLFRRFAAGRAGPPRDLGDWPVATASAGLAAAIGARSPTVRLSAETAAKQARRHPDLAAEDYARLQRILDEGELFRENSRRVMGFIEEDGRPWRAVVKATEDGSETYLLTLHRAQPNGVEIARRRLRRIDRKGEGE